MHAWTPAFNQSDSISPIQFFQAWERDLAVFVTSGKRPPRLHHSHLSKHCAFHLFKNSFVACLLPALGYGMVHHQQRKSHSDDIDGRINKYGNSFEDHISKHAAVEGH
jgi:hypothetical protein